MLSAWETRAVIGSVVAVTVGRIVFSKVEVAMDVTATRVGIGVEVNSTAGTCVAVQAVRRKKYVIARRVETQGVET